MAIQHSPQDVAEAFAARYYTILCHYPEALHKFYTTSSLMGWQGLDGLVQHVTTFEEMINKVSSTDYKSCTVKLQSVDCQKSQHGAIFVMVTGSFTWPNDETKNFAQAFFLCEQEKGYYISNDILRVYDSCGNITERKGDHSAASMNPDKNVNEVPEKEVKEVADHIISNTLAGESTVSDPPIDSSNAVEGSLYVKTSLSASATKRKVPQYEIDFPKIVTPASTEDADGKTSYVTPKLPYASVLTRESPVTSPSAKATSDFQKQHIASPKAKTPASPEKRVPTSLRDTNKSVRDEAAPVQGIYIGGLPYEVTKQDIADVLNQFGAIKRHADAIQIRKHEDGFVCALVDFESADAARLAVKAHHMRFCNKVAYISYKRRPSSIQGKESGKNIASQVGARKVDKSGR